MNSDARLTRSASLLLVRFDESDQTAIMSLHSGTLDLFADNLAMVGFNAVTAYDSAQRALYESLKQVVRYWNPLDNILDAPLATTAPCHRSLDPSPELSLPSGPAALRPPSDPPDMLRDPLDMLRSSALESIPSGSMPLPTVPPDMPRLSVSPEAPSGPAVLLGGNVLPRPLPA